MPGLDARPGAVSVGELGTTDRSEALGTALRLRVDTTPRAGDGLRARVDAGALAVGALGAGVESAASALTRRVERRGAMPSRWLRGELANRAELAPSPLLLERSAVCLGSAALACDPRDHRSPSRCALDRFERRAEVQRRPVLA